MVQAWNEVTAAIPKNTMITSSVYSFKFLKPMILCKIASMKTTIDPIVAKHWSFGSAIQRMVMLTYDWTIIPLKQTVNFTLCSLFKVSLFINIIPITSTYTRIRLYSMYFSRFRIFTAKQQRRRQAYTMCVMIITEGLSIYPEMDELDTSNKPVTEKPVKYTQMILRFSSRNCSSNFSHSVCF